MKIYLITFVSFFFITFPTFSQEVVQVEHNQRVMDKANLLSEAEKITLNTTLLEFEKQQNDGSQFFVYIVNSTQNETIEEFAYRVFNTIKIGSKTLNNGILIVMAVDDRKVRIEIGLGYEAIITDVQAGRIIRGIILPKFKMKEYFNGIMDGVIKTIHIINPKFHSSSISNEFTDYNQTVYSLENPFEHLAKFPVIIMHVCLLIFVFAILTYLKTNQIQSAILKEIYTYDNLQTKKSRDTWAQHIKRIVEYSKYKFYYPPYKVTFIVMLPSCFILITIFLFIHGYPINFENVFFCFTLAFFYNMFSLLLFYLILTIFWKPFKMQIKDAKIIAMNSPKNSILLRSYSSSFSRSSSSSSISKGRGSRGGGSSRGGGASGSW
ncbi:TPM domain-containing protein [Thorsellia kenyensis]|uniref:TPM domain-containing protein n=1 Tax=Thorsellia kenyensis TaxID=1549888 RepID=A0ABV6C826_9GAMM